MIWYEMLGTIINLISLLLSPKTTGNETALLTDCELLSATVTFGAQSNQNKYGLRSSKKGIHTLGKNWDTGANKLRNCRPKRLM